MDHTKVARRVRRHDGADEARDEVGQGALAAVAPAAAQGRAGRGPAAAVARLLREDAGRSVPAPVAAAVERATGTPVGDVRVHTGGDVGAVAESLGGEGFAVGQDVFLAQEPQGRDGWALLLHELAHTLQTGPLPRSQWDRLRVGGEGEEAEAAAVAERAVAIGWDGLATEGAPIRVTPAPADVIRLDHPSLRARRRGRDEPLPQQQARTRSDMERATRAHPGQGLSSTRPNDAADVLGDLPRATATTAGADVTNYDEPGERSYASGRAQDEAGRDVFRVGVGERVVVPVAPGTDPLVYSSEFHHCGGTVIRATDPRTGQVFLLVGHVANGDPVGHWERLRQDVAWLRSRGLEHLEVLAVVHPEARGESDGDSPDAYFGFPDEERARAQLSGEVEAIHVMTRAGDEEVHLVASQRGVGVVRGERSAAAPIEDAMDFEGPGTVPVRPTVRAGTPEAPGSGEGTTGGGDGPAPRAPARRGQQGAAALADPAAPAPRGRRAPADAADGPSLGRALRRMLQARADDTERPDADRALARLALRDLEQQGPRPSAAQVAAVADAAGVPMASLRRDAARGGAPSADAPEAPRAAQPRPVRGAVSQPDQPAAQRRRRREAAPEEPAEPTVRANDERTARQMRAPQAGGPVDVEATPDSVEATWNDSQGRQRQAAVQASRRGVEVSTSLTPPDASGETPARDQRRASLGVTLEHGADGVQGADITLGAGLGPTSGTFRFGGTYYAASPRVQRDGSVRVAWRVSFRAGSSVSRRFGRMSGGVAADGELTRQGTNVFRADTTEEALRQAEQFRERFRSMSQDGVLRELLGLVTASQGTVEWWREQEPGTARTVQIGGGVTPSLSGRVLGILQVGVSVPVRARATATVRKSAAGAVQVTQGFLVTVIPEASAGAGVSVSAGIGYTYQADLTYAVDLQAGEQALRRFLAREALVEEGQAGVTLQSQRVEEGVVDSAGVEVALLADISGRSGVTTITSTERGADGQDRQTTSYRAFDEMEGSLVTGAYARRRVEMVAPTSSEGRYRVSRDLHSTESRRSSGNWQVEEEFTPEQMREFHRRFLANRGDDRGGLTCYDRAAAALRDVSQGAEGDAQRARIIADLVDGDGERAIDIISSLAGGPSSRSVRLFNRRGEDTTFLSPSERSALEARLQRYEQAAAAAARGTAPPASMAGAIQADVAAMQQRIEALRDPARYRDLPVSRQELLADWGRLLARLEALAVRLDASADDRALAGLSEDGRASYAAMMERQAAMEQARGRATMLRDQVVAARRRWGQDGPGTADRRLPPRLAARATALWSEGQTGYEGAESARQGAERLLDGLRHTEEGQAPGELDTLRVLRSAVPELQRAEATYGAASEAFAALAALYMQADEAAPGGRVAPQADQQADRRGARRAQARERREGASQGAAPRASQRRLRLHPERLRRCVTDPRAATAPHGTMLQVDSSREVELGNGLVVRVLAAGRTERPPGIVVSVQVVRVGRLDTLYFDRVQHREGRDPEIVSRSREPVAPGDLRAFTLLDR